MFVPIIIDPNGFYDYRYLWVYLKYIYHCSKNEWPIIADEEFRIYKEKRPISNVYEDKFMNAHQYCLLSSEDEERVDKFYIPSRLFEPLIKKCGSRLGARLFLLSNRYKPLEQYLKCLLKKIERKEAEKISGILIWNSGFVSIRYVADKMKIPVITSEFSIRFPEYYTLAYLCKDELFSCKEIQSMYMSFRRQKSDLDFPMLTRKELLALFIVSEYIDEIDRDVNEEYEMGIAGCHPFIPTFFVKNTYTDLELIEDVRKRYSEDDIIFRQHPGDEPYNAQYRMKNYDNSEKTFDFIRRCKRMTAIGSNIILESIMWGKPTYTNKISPYYYFTEKNLDNKNTEIVNDEILNFILLGYMVPYNRLFDENFILERLAERNIAKIIKKNVEYYFKEMNIPIDVLYDTENRYERIKSYRKKQQNQSACP